jgi:hypothetical protein
MVVRGSRSSAEFLGGGMTGLELVKVQVVPAPDQVGNLAGSALQERFTDRVGELTDVIKDVASELRRRIETGLEKSSSATWGLERIEMNFSVELEAGAGVVVARTSTRGGFSVTLSFARVVRAQGED